MNIMRLGIVLLASAQLIGAAPDVSKRMSELCLENSANDAAACTCLGDLVQMRLGVREREIIVARQEGREDAARALMKGLNLAGAIRLVKDLKNFKEEARRDCKVKLRMK